jgi:hypothetical protein
MQLVTERDAILRERAAYVRGFHTTVSNCNTRIENQYAPARADSERFARELYPLPRVTRPRVVYDKQQALWRCVAGYVEVKLRGEKDFSKLAGTILYMTDERIAILDDLRANPTEEVEADD